MTEHNAEAKGDCRRPTKRPWCSAMATINALHALRKLALRVHYYCEDSWYSCPKAEGGCANENAGDECNCGAEEHNAEVERVLADATAARQ